MSDKDITLLDFQKSYDKVLILHQSYRALLRSLQDFVRYNVSENITDYTLGTRDDFDTYCIDAYNIHATIPIIQLIIIISGTMTLAVST